MLHLVRTSLGVVVGAAVSSVPAALASASAAVPLGNERDYVTDDALPENYVYSNAEANRYDSVVKPYKEEFRNKYHLQGF
jgi:hypothetical protein